MADSAPVRPVPIPSEQPYPWRRVTLAGAAAAALFGGIALGVLPVVYAMPAIGLLLACGARPDTAPDARPLRACRRNTVLGALLVLLAVVVALQTELKVALAIVVGLWPYGIVMTVLPIALVALPFGMAESATGLDDLPPGRIVLTRRNLILALTVLVTVATWYAILGLSFVVLAVLVLGLPVVLAVSRLRQARLGRVHRVWWRHRWHVAQLLNVALLCVLLAVLILPGTFTLLQGALPPVGYRAFQVWYVVGLVGLVLLALVPLRQVQLGSNVLVIAGSAFLVVELVMIYRPAVEPVTVSSPLSTEWYVGQGGHAELVNYHQYTSVLADAVDIVQVRDGRTHPEGRTDLDSYYVYEQPLLAPADGVVTSVVDGLRDQPIGSVDPDPANQAGNHVVIDIGGGRYLMIGHLRQDTVRVAVGDRVRTGQVLAMVGNSGNTDEPHVHIQAQNLPELDLGTDDPIALLRTLRTYPLVFRDVVLTRDGTTSTPAAADPRRGDLVKPVG